MITSRAQYNYTVTIYAAWLILKIRKNLLGAERKLADNKTWSKLIVCKALGQCFSVPAFPHEGIGNTMDKNNIKLYK